MKILGISAFYHDSAAALIEDGKIKTAVQEERLSRIKHDARFPGNAIRYCLEETGTTIDELEAVVFYEKPFLKFERLLETYYAFAPNGISSFIAAMPIWLKEKMFIKKILHDELQKISTFNKNKLKLLFPEHHLSHAASAFYPSPFENAAIITLDGVGEWATASIALGAGKSITIHKELDFPHSVGLLYSAFTYFLGFRVNSGEYKLMGLAPYGHDKSRKVEDFIRIIKDKLVTIKNDGSIWLNQKYFHYAKGLRMVKDKTWEKLLGMPRRMPESEIHQGHCDLALAIQKVTEEIILKMAREAKKLTNAQCLCMAGGVALNSVANGKLRRENIFKEIFIQPAAGDAGGAIGTAQAAYHIYFEQPRKINSKNDGMAGAFLGPDIQISDIKKLIKQYHAPHQKYENFENLANEVATQIAEGNVVGWIQGRMEFGPRALGARSILADPGNKEMQRKLNLKIKFRESFRPFAPSVLAEDYQELFETNGYPNNPYMLFVEPVKNFLREEVPNNFNNYTLREKLYHPKSHLPAITHADFSARVQTVRKEMQPKFWQLINELKKITGYGMVVNTSFNVRGEPIVCSPEDAYKCFMRTEMDYLVIENYLFKKTEQHTWKETREWQQQLILD